MVFRWTN